MSTVVRQICTPRVFVVAAAFILAATTFGSAHGGDSHALTLTPQSADQLADGTVVVTSVAAGDLAGVLTVQLKPNGAGTFDGEWAFTIAHTDTTDPETGVEPELHAHHGEAEHTHDAGGAEHAHDDSHHRDFMRLIHRGALSGTIGGATAIVDGQGQLLDVQAPLTIDQGSLEFDGASGSGQATLTALTLTF